MVKLWRKSHLDRILREDLLDLEKVHQIKKIEILVDLLAERVGSIVNYSSLARDLEVSSHTIKHWLQILEDLYVVFKVLPYTQNISKSILKSPKFYFYDIGRLKNETGSKLENLVACHLLARNQYLNDCKGEKVGLYYLQDKSKREVDFVLTHEHIVTHLIEVKSKNSHLSPSLKYFNDKLTPQNSLQLVYNIETEKQYGNIKIKDLTHFLHELII